MRRPLHCPVKHGDIWRLTFADKWDVLSRIRRDMYIIINLCFGIVGVSKATRRHMQCSADPLDPANNLILRNLKDDGKSGQATRPRNQLLPRLQVSHGGCRFFPFLADETHGA